MGFGDVTEKRRRMAETMKIGYNNSASQKGRRKRDLLAK